MIENDSLMDILPLTENAINVVEDSGEGIKTN